jgi:hypothetical protein
MSPNRRPCLSAEGSVFPDIRAPRSNKKLYRGDLERTISEALGGVRLKVPAGLTRTCLGRRLGYRIFHGRGHDPSIDD